MRGFPGKTEEINVVLENGFSLKFNGYLFSETVCYERQTTVLLHLQLYLTESRAHVYLIRRESREKVSTHGYILSVTDGKYSIFDGQDTLHTDAETLINAVSVFGGNNSELCNQTQDILGSIANSLQSNKI